MNADAAHPADFAAQGSSVSHRFTLALTGVVTLLLVAFAIIAIVIENHRMERDLQELLDDTSRLAQVSLKIPLWNVDTETITSVAEALLLQSPMVFVEVQVERERVALSTVPEVQGMSFAELAKSSGFMTKVVDITRDGKPIGTVYLALSRAELQQLILFRVAGIVALIVLMIGAIAATSLWITRRFIARPLTALQRSAGLITTGNLDAAIDTSQRDEIGQLALKLNTMRGSLKALIEEQHRNEARLEDANRTLEQRVEERNAQVIALNAQLQTENLRMGSELEVTRRLQLMLLPSARELQQVRGLDIAGHMQPAVEVGGDYFDVLQHEGRVKIGIGDVTGHGLESGVLMVMTQAIVRALLISGELDPVRYLDILNRALFGNVQRMGGDKNLTLCLLDYADGEVKLSGQHEVMLVVRRDGTIERIDTIDLGFPIGLVDEISEFIGQTTVKLQPGDGIVLYTDGITEAENMANAQYGLERLCSVLSLHWHLSADGIKNAVIADLALYIGAQTVYDDITLVVVKQQQQKMSPI